MTNGRFTGNPFFDEIKMTCNFYVCENRSPYVWAYRDINVWAIFRRCPYFIPWDVASEDEIIVTHNVTNTRRSSNRTIQLDCFRFHKRTDHGSVSEPVFFLWGRIVKFSADSCEGNRGQTAAWWAKMAQTRLAGLFVQTPFHNQAMCTGLRSGSSFFRPY